MRAETLRFKLLVTDTFPIQCWQYRAHKTNKCTTVWMYNNRGSPSLTVKLFCLYQVDSHSHKWSGVELLQESRWGSYWSVVLHHWPWETLWKLLHPPVQRWYIPYITIKHFIYRSWNVSIPRTLLEMKYIIYYLLWENGNNILRNYTH